MNFQEIIRKRGSKWVVLSKDGKKVLGTHDTKASALRQLRAIEISKHSSYRLRLESLHKELLEV